MRGYARGFKCRTLGNFKLFNTRVSDKNIPLNLYYTYMYVVRR